MIRKFFNCSLSKTQIQIRACHGQFNSLWLYATAYMHAETILIFISFIFLGLPSVIVSPSKLPVHFKSICIMSIYTNSVNFGSRLKSYDWPDSGIRINGKSLLCSSSLRPGTNVGRVKMVQESRYKRFVPKGLRLCVFLFRNTINRPLTQRKKLILHDAQYVTPDFLAKWRLRNERRNSILMTCHNPDLSSIFHWLKNLWWRHKMSTVLSGY